MTQDFKIHMTRDGDQIAFTIFGRDLGQAGTPLNSRQIPALNQALIEQLRQGEIADQDIDLITSQIRSWFLANDLLSPLRMVIRSLSGDQLRLVFHIDQRLREDTRLSDEFVDMPFELLTLRNNDMPLVLHNGIIAFVHYMDKVAPAPVSVLSRTSPLRVLIVQANPTELGGKVPDPAPIRQEILNMSQHLGPNIVKVDMLCREDQDGKIGLPTRDGLLMCLGSEQTYDILVFLGHGGRDKTRPDMLPLPLLYLEAPNGQDQDPLWANKLAVALESHPVPVILLVGCLTAASVPIADWASLKAGLPIAMRGNQGMAQALVNTTSGVQIAVGMRYRLETDDATCFLKGFFRGLLIDSPGNIEAAVRAGRCDLYTYGYFPASYSAPVIYSETIEEPVFPFLASPPSIPMPESFQKYRGMGWNQMKGASSQNEGLIQSLGEMLQDLDQDLIENMRPRAPLVMPVWQLGEPEISIDVPILLYGNLKIDELECNLVISGQNAVIERVECNDAVRDNGYTLFSDAKGNRAGVRIQSNGTNQKSLPTGELMVLKLKLGTDIGVIYPISIDLIKIKPHRQICLANSAVIVPLP